MFGKRIVSLFLCLVITLSLSGVASAEDYINRPVGFWNYIQRALVNGMNAIPFGSVFNAFGALTFNEVCGSSADAYHHTDSIKGATLGEDSHGQYANATCKYCAKPFKVYSSDLSAAYDDYVDDLQDKTGTATLLNGGIRVYPVFVRYNTISTAQSIVSNMLNPPSGLESLPAVQNSTTRPKTVDVLAAL